MKKLVSLCVMLALLFTWMSSIPVNASAIVINSGSCGENLIWSLDSNGLMTISGSGEMYDWDSGSYYVPWYSVRENIKEVIIENGITSIGVNAFYYCSNITSVSIPDGITKINYGAFGVCTSLSQINIPKDVTYIGEQAFFRCTNLNRITIPDSVTFIGSSAFSDCQSLVVYYQGDYSSWQKIYENGNDNVNVEFITDETQKKVYYISTAEELNDVRNDLTGTYILQNDIDLTNYDNWIPIGDERNRFEGVMDGCGYTISNLTIDSNENYVGLFGYTDKSFQIKNLNIINANVKGADNVGILIGNSGYRDNSLSGQISYCNIEGKVSGNDFVGGVAGQCRTPVFSCGFAGEIDGNQCVGGMFGVIDDATFERCSSQGSVCGQGDVGGLIGHINDAGAFVYNSYSTMNVTGQMNTAGFIGYCWWNSSQIEYCYSAGKVINATGGFVGNNEGIVRNCFYNSDNCQHSINDKGDARTTQELTDLSIYEAWNFEDIWKIDSNTNEGYPSFQNSGTSQYISVSRVELSENFVSIYPGEKLELNAHVKPMNATNQNVIWKSSDTAIATVDNGIVTAVSPGTTTITVETEDGGKTATSNITVERTVSSDDTGEEPPTCLTVANASSRKGKEIVVPITISNNRGITGLQLECTFDDILTLTNVEVGTALSNLEFTTPGDLATNNVNFLWDGMDADDSNGEILYLTFNVSEDAKIGDYDITLNVNTACDQNLEDVNVETKSGTISIIEYTPGDVNEDDEVNVKDIILIRRYIAGGYNVTLLEPAANVDENDEINVKDIILLRRFIAGGYGVELN